MIFSGILTAISIVVVAAKFSRQTLKRMLGLDKWIDMTVTIGLGAGGFMLGSYVAAMTGIVTGLCISGVLWVAGNLIGRDTLTKSGWVEGKPVWTVASLSAFWHSGKLQSVVVSAKDQWNSGKDKGVSIAA